MRTTALLSFVALAFAALGEAKNPPKGGKQVCTTAYCDQKGTRTSYVADQTSTVVKPAPPCYTTTTAYVTPKARVVTSITPSLSTTVVQAAQQTDTFTLTSISYAVTVPTTTKTVASVTPTVTVGTTVVPNPGVPAVTTVTKYTIVGPKPSTNPLRRNEKPSLDSRSKQKSGMNAKSPVILGKNVVCHEEYTETVTQTAPCRTITGYSRLPQQTTTSTSTLVIPVTSTQVPRDAQTVVTVPGGSSTITASTITFSYTYTASPTTTTATSTAPLATNTVYAAGYQGCDPSTYVDAANYNVNYDTLGYTTAPDALACCDFAASMVGGLAFKFESSAVNGCLYSTADYANDCPKPAAGFDMNGPIAKFGLLQCATPSDP